MAMQGGYLNSPEYQQWVQMQQANQMNNLRTPFSGLASVLTSGINAYGMKQAKAQYDAKEMQKASLLASLLQREPVDSVAATPALSNPETSAADLQSRKDTGAYNQPTTQAPDISSRLAQLLAGGGSGEAGSELVNSLAPALIQSQLAQQEQANQPITPYQKANLAQQRAGDVEAGRRFDFQQIGESERDLQSTLERSNARSQTANEARNQRTFTAGENALNRENQLNVANARLDASASNVFGRGMEGRAYNILGEGLKNPAIRSTAEYATAWQILSNPKVDPATGTVITPDLSAFAPPEKGGAAPGAQSQAEPPQARMPNITAFAPPNPSVAESSSAGFATRMKNSGAILDDPKVQEAGSNLGNRGKAAVPILGNYMVGPEYQKFDQAQRDFINAQLRRESGAVISPEEFNNARKQYLPQPGDSAEVKEQKRKNRELVIKNMELSAGNTMLPAGVMQQVTPPRGAPTVPMSQGFGDSMPQQNQPRIRTYNPQTGQLE